GKNIFKDMINVKIEPVIEEMKEGVKKRLTASLVYKDGTPVDMTGLENIQWNWSITGNEDDDYAIEPIRTNSTQADFTLYKGNFMDIIVSAKVDFSVAEKRWVRLNSAGVKESSAQTRVVSREFSIEGDNQVPIMIVNEDDRRIKNIPMINPDDLEGITSGDCNVSENKIFADLKLLTNYSVNVKDKFEFSFSDNETGKTYSGIAEETENNSYIYEGTDKDGRAVEFYMPKPIQQNIIIASRKNLLDNGEIQSIRIDEQSISDESMNVGFYDNGEQKYFSNMVIENQESLNQEEFINKNSIFKIKVLSNEDLGDKITGKLKIGDNENYYINEVELYKEKTDKRLAFSTYILASSVIVAFEYSIKDVVLKNKRRRIIKGGLNNIKNSVYFLFNKMQEYKEIGSYNKIAYMGKAFGRASFYDDFENIAKLINNLDYTVRLDHSLTKREFIDNINNSEILYIFSHGTIGDIYDNDDGIIRTGKLKVFVEKKDDIDIDHILISYKDFIDKNPNFKLVFFNGCDLGKPEWREKFLEVLNTKIYISWVRPVNSTEASYFAKKFFELLNQKDEENDEYFTVRKALLKTLSDVLGEVIVSSSEHGITNSENIYATGEGLDSPIKEN
ncbi:MAG: hypothetical protein M0R46_10890, partial [Candidatus Muirbacterium halophilum]|nr:hypothetical protein [Candidatus Muirbacterium halophilum]